jgi:hypothetical protein
MQAAEYAIEAAAEAAQDAYIMASEAAAVARLAARKARRISQRTRPIAAATLAGQGVAISDIAARLGCSSAWARELVKRGRILVDTASA